MASSGLLVPEIGGPSVKPYQPKGIWEAATSGRGLSKYVQDHGNDLYRRTMYTFIKRTVPPPSMLVFDASNRDQCEVKRLNTNTPLQALVMMNDPQVLEASRVLAERTTAEVKGEEGQIQTAFRKIICRTPDSKELNVLLKYYRSSLEQAKADPAGAAKLCNAGEYPRNTKLAQETVYALMKVIMTIYNLDEAIVRT